VDLFDSLLADGQNVIVFLEFTALALPQIMLLFLPVASFVATLYIFNRLIGDSELVVLQTAGLSALRLLRPVLVFGVVVCALIAVLSNVLAPAARSQFNDRSLEVQEDLTGRFLRAGQFIHPTPGLTVYIREITDLGEFHDVFLQDRSNPDVEVTYTAARALLVRSDGGPRLVMFDGMAQTLQPQGARLATVEFTDFTYDIAGLIGTADLRRREIAELSTMALLTADADTAERLGLNLAHMRFEGHDRIARALFAAFPPLIAAAVLMLGTFSRFGVWPQIVVAVFLMIPLQMIWNVSETIAVRDVALQYVAYVQPVAAALMAAVLAWLAMRPRRRRRAQARMVPA
jgi:lipopolysaccharide export system permease protein